MKLFLSLVLLLVVPFAMAQEIHENILENATYNARLAYFETHPLKDGQIVFLGNSLTQAGKWAEYFPQNDVANRGIAGDNTLGMLNRLTKIIEAKPTKIFILAGINDISLNRSNDKIMIGIQSIVYQLQEGTPTSRIYLQSVLPINNEKKRYKRMLGKEKQIVELNEKIKKFCEHNDIIFVDLYSHFLSGKDTLNANYTTDGLHLTDEGYMIWKNVLTDYINQ